MGPLGMGEIIVIFILALLIFGPKKLPELGRTFGKGMAEFKRASNELKSTFQREMDTIEQETREVKNLTNEAGKEIDTSYYNDEEEDYYDAYDYDDGTKTSGNAASSNGASTNKDAPATDSAGEENIDPDSSGKEAADGAAAAAETPSEDGSSADDAEAAEMPVAAAGADVGKSEPKTA